jgi:hypothetical protein
VDSVGQLEHGTVHRRVVADQHHRADAIGNVAQPLDEVGGARVAEPRLEDPLAFGIDELMRFARAERSISVADELVLAGVAAAVAA